VVHLIPWLERRWSFDLPVGAFPAVLERLAGTPARAAALAAGVPESILARRPASAWSVKEHIGHLSDLHALDIRRVDEFLGRATVLSGADPSNRRTEEGHHRDTPIAQLLDTFQQQRQSLTRLLGKLTEEDVAAAAVHPRLGVAMRLIDWAQFVADHDDHHLAAARIALHALDGPHS
jgi:hypothetical protein